MTGITVGSRAAQQEAAIEPVIDAEFALDALPDACRDQASGQHVGQIGVRLS